MNERVAAQLKKKAAELTVVVSLSIRPLIGNVTNDGRDYTISNLQLQDQSIRYTH